jgi:nitroreductase
MIHDLILMNRSYRRFDQTVPITRETLMELIDLARLSASSANQQPLKYLISWEAERNLKIFDTLAWAGYLKEWHGPDNGERPTAYIIILGDKSVKETFGIDPGIAMQSILLGAVEKGLGGCMFGSVQRAKLRTSLELPEQYEILYVIALGKPVEIVTIEAVGDDGDIKYWRDANQIHHVPKRSLADLIIE